MQFIRISMKEFALSLSKSMDRYVLDNHKTKGPAERLLIESAQRPVIR